MPGRNKPLITRNGIPDPQAYNPQTGQWESFMGVSWGKTAGGLYAPIRVDDQGRQEVTLSGNIVSEKYVTLVNAAEVRSASVPYNLITHGGLTEELIRKYRSFKISITSTLDKEITVSLYSMPRSSGSTATKGMIIYREESAVKVGDLDGVIVISPKAGGVGTTDRWKVVPALEGVVHSNLGLYLMFVGGAPTSGSLTIGVEMHG